LGNQLVADCFHRLDLGRAAFNMARVHYYY
jgi:hypothetical protein